MQKRQHLKYHELEGCVKLLHHHQEFTEKVGSEKRQLGPHCDARLVGRRAVSRGLKHTAFQPQSSHSLRCGLDQLLEHKCL